MNNEFTLPVEEEAMEDIEKLDGKVESRRGVL